MVQMTIAVLPPFITDSERHRGHKSWPTRTIVLALFFSALATCLILVEVLLQHSSKPVTADTSSQETAHLKHLNRANRRGSTKSIACESCRAMMTSAASLSRARSSLCSEFSTSFITGIQLSPSQSLEFQAWSSKFGPVSSSMTLLASSILWEALTPCAVQNEPLATAYAQVHDWDGCRNDQASGSCDGLKDSGNFYLDQNSIAQQSFVTCPPLPEKALTLTSIPTVTVTVTVTVTAVPPSGQVITLTSLPTVTVTETITETVTVPGAPEQVLTLISLSLLTVTVDRRNKIVSSSSEKTTLDHHAGTVPTSASVNHLSGTISSEIWNMYLKARPTSIRTTMQVVSTQPSVIFARSQNAASVLSSTKVVPESNAISSMTATVTQSPPAESIYTLTTRYTGYHQTIDSEGRSTSSLAIIISRTVITGSPSDVTSASSPRISSGTASATATGWPLANLTAMNVVTVDGTFTHLRYFAAFYLPPILAVIVKTFWEIIFASFKMMQPFEQLSKKNGVPAKQGLFAQYLSNSISISSLKSSFIGGGTLLLTTTLYLCITITAALAASSMTVRATQNCPLPDGRFVRCGPAWVIDIALIRSIEALLLVCILLTILIVAYNIRRRSNIYTDSSSIAAVASLIGQDALITEFQAANPLADINTLSADFENNRYRLGFYTDAANEERYGIFRVANLIHHEPAVQFESKKPSISRWSTNFTAEASALITPSEKAKSSPFVASQWQARLLDSAQFFTTAGLLSLISAYVSDSSSAAFNRFFNSDTLEARLTFVLCASLVDIQWKRLEREVRITEPYRRMAQGPQRPETTVLIALNGTCWSSFFTSLYKLMRGFQHMWFQTLVSFVTALSDINIIAVATMVYSDGQTWNTWLLGSRLAMTITSMLTAVMLIVMIWWRRTVVSEMPRCPDTIGAVMSYLCASRFTRDLNLSSSASMSPKARDDMIIAAGWKFSFKWQAGLDGKERWCVDYDTPEDDGGLVYSHAI